MKKLSCIFLLLFACSLFSCKAQDHSAKNRKEVQDTTRVYLYGSVRVKETNEPVEYVPFMVFKGKVSYTFKNASRVIQADKNGQFKIDITGLKDSTQILVIRCKFIKHAQTEIVINGKFKTSIPLDILIVPGEGLFFTEYNFDPKKSTLKLVKQTSEVTPDRY